jgi:hypothetical protein
MIRSNFVFVLLLFVAAVWWAQEEIESAVTYFDDGRKGLLNGFLGGLLTFRFADLGVVTYDKEVFFQEAKIRPGETKGYKVKFTKDVSELIVGVVYQEDKFGANAFLEVNLESRFNPRLRGSINTDSKCRAEKIEGSAFTGTIFCSFNTSPRGDGTAFIWVTGKRFTTYNMYVSQVSNKAPDPV